MSNTILYQNTETRCGSFSELPCRAGIWKTIRKHSVPNRALFYTWVISSCIIVLGQQPYDVSTVELTTAFDQAYVNHQNLAYQIQMNCLYNKLLKFCLARVNYKKYGRLRFNARYIWMDLWVWSDQFIWLFRFVCLLFSNSNDSVVGMDTVQKRSNRFIMVYSVVLTFNYSWAVLVSTILFWYYFIS